MLTRIIKSIAAARAWILSFSCFAVILLIVVTSKPFQSCVKEHNYDRAADNFDNSVSSVKIFFEVYRSCLGEFTHDNAEAIIAAFTIMLALSTIFLWVATRDLVEGADKTAERQLRAYLLIDTAKFARPENENGDNQHWAIHLVFKNFGRTPAYATVVTATRRMEPRPLGNDVLLEIPDDAEVAPETIVGPGHIHTMTLGGLQNGARDFIEAGRSGQACYAWGRAEYIDAFGQPHFTTFQMICLFGQVHQFGFCRQGNGTDDRFRRPRRFWHNRR
jgi:hypothetical protein